jgi:methionine-rich copper-binding protein CopC|tara:strand:- start:109 stop:522 length:414 start_codon:yes stop_codon:yes gene_type:complete
MATLRVTVTLNSASVLASPVNVAAEFSAAADSGILSRAKVVKTAVDANALEVYTANDKTESAYLFLKNLDVEKENYVTVYNDTDSDGHVSKIGGGEFCFIPVAVNKSYRVFGTKVDQMVEFGVFGLDSSAAGPFNQN